MFDLFGKKITLSVFLLIALYGLTQPVGTNLPNYDKEWLHFGITLNSNVSSYKIYRDLSLNTDDSIMTVNSTRNPGFGVGIISNIAFLDYFDLRFIPTLSFATRRISYQMVTALPASKATEFINVEFPMHLKVKSARMDNFRFYMLGGGKYSYNMVSNSNATDEKARYLVITDPGFWALEYGAGTDFYFEMFKFSLEVKLTDGMGSILKDGQTLRYATVIDKLIPKTILFSLHFE